MRRTYRYPRYRRAAAPFELTYVCTGSAGAVAAGETSEG